MTRVAFRIFEVPGRTTTDRESGAFVNQSALSGFALHVLSGTRTGAERGSCTRSGTDRPEPTSRRARSFGDVAVSSSPTTGEPCGGLYSPCCR
jgi:hypothetical protein